MNKLKKLINRLEKLKIKIELSGNYPWVYLDKVNSKKVLEKFGSDWGFVVLLITFKPESQKFYNTKKLFKIIRRYR